MEHAPKVSYIRPVLSEQITMQTIIKGIFATQTFLHLCVLKGGGKVFSCNWYPQHTDKRWQSIDGRKINIGLPTDGTMHIEQGQKVSIAAMHMMNITMPRRTPVSPRGSTTSRV